MACHSIPDPAIPDPAIPDPGDSNGKTWLQLYVDAMTEKDPYKRLALVRQLRNMPKHDDSEEPVSELVIRPIRGSPVKRAKVVRRH